MYAAYLLILHGVREQVTAFAFSYMSGRMLAWLYVWV